MNGHQVKHPRCLFIKRAWPARTKDRLPLLDDFRLNEKIAECRMQCVRSRFGKHNLSVTCDVNCATHPRAVGDVHTPQFHVVFRRNNDLGMRTVVMVAAAKLCPPFRENHFVRFRSLERRLMGIRPERSAREIADITKHAPVVASRVLAPAGNGETFPAAVAAARICHHHVIVAVR